MTRVSGSAPYWLRGRLGCGGTARLRIVERLRDDVPELGPVCGESLGFNATELSAFSRAYDLDAIARRITWRGDVDRLRSIAWWGSALGDVASGERRLERTSTLAEAAAFNLAVALFDSVVERGRESSTQLTTALAPDRIRHRLLRPSDEGSRIACRDATLDLVAGLFDRVLASVGRRLAGRLHHLESLARQLESMYLSEIGVTADPFVAKSGPVILIGALSGDADLRCKRRLFNSLGHFCQLWDDSLDIAEDLRSAAPNTFLGVPHRAGVAGTARFWLNGLGRVIAGDRMHERIALRLAAGLRETLAAARECDPGTQRRTLALCRALVN